MFRKKILLLSSGLMCVDSGIVSGKFRTRDALRPVPPPTHIVLISSPVWAFNQMRNIEWKIYTEGV
jgi:hypothetical protein